MKHRSVLLLLALLALGLSASAPAPDDDPRRVLIQPVGNEMKFAQTAFTVKTGEEIRLVFENTATAEAMRHNVVILTSEEAINRVGVAAIQAAANDYIPDDDAILFYTPLAEAGETVEVTFTAPAPGTYYYTCTYPGHYVLMRGVMTVTS